MQQFAIMYKFAAFTQMQHGIPPTWRVVVTIVQRMASLSPHVY